MESLSTGLTKGNVSRCTFLPQNKQILLLVHANKQLLCLLLDRFDARKATHTLLSHTPHIHINQLFICFLHSARLAHCLPVTVSSDKTHACQSQTGWHLQTNQISLRRISSFALENPMTNWVNYRKLKNDS